MEFKDQVKAAIDLREVFAAYSIKLQKVNGTSSKCCCPVHNEKTPSCNVHPDYYHCFGCGASGDIFSFIMDRERVEFFEALRIAAERVNMPMPASDPQKAAEYQAKRSRQATLRQVLDSVQEFYRDCLENQPVGADALKYCKQRGWLKPIRESFGIGLAPDDGQLMNHVSNALQVGSNDLEPMLQAAGIMGQSDSGYCYLRFKSRIMFPVHDGRGRLCGFSGRWMRPADWDNTRKEPAKYLNTPETEIFDKGNLLFGQVQASQNIAKSNSAIIVEGQPDVIACHVAGINTAVAPLGTSLTLDQLQQLGRLVDNSGRLLIMFDGDNAGQAATAKALAQIRSIV